MAEWEDWRMCTKAFLLKSRTRGGKEDSHSNWISIYEKISVVCSRVVLLVGLRAARDKMTCLSLFSFATHNFITIIISFSFSVDCVSCTTKTLSSFRDFIWTFFLSSSWMAQLWFNNPHSECHLIYLADARDECLLLQTRRSGFFSFFAPSINWLSIGSSRETGLFAGKVETCRHESRGWHVAAAAAAAVQST